MLKSVADYHNVIWLLCRTLTIMKVPTL